MSDRMDITSRDLNRGQNDSAAAERLEFPGFKRSWNVRGRRETARRRLGWTQTSLPANITDGCRGFASDNAAKFAIVSDNGELKNYWTIDLCFLAIVNPAGTRPVVGASAAASEGVLRVYYTATTLTVEVWTATGTVTFTMSSAHEFGQPYHIRVTARPNEIRCYFGGEPVQSYTGVNVDVPLANGYLLFKDYAHLGAEECHMGWYRVMGRSIFNRGGMYSLHPRPRDEDVYLELYSDQGPGFLTDGVTNYIQDHSSYMRHSAIAGAVFAGQGMQDSHVQFIGQIPARDEASVIRYPMLVDGDLVEGRDY
jgi:hypothetical protein